MEHHGTPLETLRSELRRGFAIESVSSTDDEIVIDLVRDGQTTTLRLDKQAASQILSEGPPAVEPMHA